MLSVCVVPGVFHWNGALHALLYVVVHNDLGADCVFLSFFSCNSRYNMALLMLMWGS